MVVQFNTVLSLETRVKRSFLFHFQVLLLLRPGAALADQLPGVGGDAGAARAGQTLRREGDLEEVGEAGDELGRDTELGGARLRHNDPGLGLTVPDLQFLLERLAGEGVLGEVPGQAELEDGLHHGPDGAGALVGLLDTAGDGGEGRGSPPHHSVVLQALPEVELQRLAEVVEERPRGCSWPTVPTLPRSPLRPDGGHLSGGRPLLQEEVLVWSRHGLHGRDGGQGLLGLLDRSCQTPGLVGQQSLDQSVPPGCDRLQFGLGEAGVVLEVDGRQLRLGLRQKEVRRGGGRHLARELLELLVSVSAGVTAVGAVA